MARARHALSARERCSCRVLFRRSPVGQASAALKETTMTSSLARATRACSSVEPKSTSFDTTSARLTELTRDPGMCPSISPARGRSNSTSSITEASRTNSLTFRFLPPDFLSPLADQLLHRVTPGNAVLAEQRLGHSNPLKGSEEMDSILVDDDEKAIPLLEIRRLSNLRRKDHVALGPDARRFRFVRSFLHMPPSCNRGMA